MTDIQFLILLKTAFKEHLKAEKTNVKPSFQQLLEIIELFRDQAIENHIKTQSNDKRNDEK